MLLGIWRGPSLLEADKYYPFFFQKDKKEGPVNYRPVSFYLVPGKNMGKIIWKLFKNT